MGVFLNAQTRNIRDPQKILSTKNVQGIGKTGPLGENHTLLIESPFENLFDVHALDNSFANIVSHIVAISIPNFTLNFERDPFTRRFIPSSNPITYPREVKITWKEGRDFEVYKYHIDWFSKYYDTESQTWVSGVEGKYHSLEVYFNLNSDKIFYSEGEALNTPLKVVLKDIGLSQTPQMNLEYEKTDVVKYDLTYSIGGIDIGENNDTRTVS